jgi:hypothetical protein
MAYWNFRSIDTMSRSRDQAQSQLFKPQIVFFCQQLARLHPTHLTYCGPYDAPSTYGAQPGWMEAWLGAIRATGRHVWFRMLWNNWQGTFSQPILTANTTPAIPYETDGRVTAVLSGSDTTSYLYKTYQWILDHPTVFQDGDVFSPASEPSNAGIEPYSAQTPAQFPNLAAYVAWLADVTVLCRVAFQHIGKQVFVGFMSPGWVSGAANAISSDTARILGSPMSVDTYVTQPQQVVNILAALSYTWRSTMVLGEWGVTSGTTESSRVQAVNATYGAVSALPFVVGVNYFEGWSYPGNSDSGDGLLNPNTLQILPHGQTVGQWFLRQTPPWRRPILWAGAGLVTGAALYYRHRTP